MNVGELKKVLEGVPDNTLVVVSNYNDAQASPEIKRGLWIFDDENEDDEYRGGFWCEECAFEPTEEILNSGIPAIFLAHPSYDF